ncbi:MAG: hypothetical protein HYY93_06185 [Planctomycetes bacterium]|nr:hypothetical protein [Planctomycetota bacterium]
MTDAVPPTAPESVPEWASFLSSDQYRDFLAIVSSELDARALNGTIRDGVVRFDHPTAGQLSAGLQNLAQLCHQHPSRRWRKIVHDHFDLFERIESDRVAFDADARVLPRVQSLLKTRLCAAESLDVEDPGSLVTRDVGPGLVALLTFDRPEVVQSVSREQATEWPITIDEALKVGVENVRRGGRLAAKEFPLTGGTSLQALLAEDFFVSTHALFLGDYLPEDSRHGAIVAVPHRHAVLFHPIRDLSVLKAVEAMLVVAAGMFREGPGSVSPFLYWWQKEEWTLLPVEVQGEQVAFTPPPEFVELLEVLPPAEGEGPEGLDGGGENSLE